jgi:hypothetical protein
VVALHDSRPMPGRQEYDSVRFTESVVLRDPAFTVLDAVDSLTVLQRTSPGRHPRIGSQRSADSRVAAS